MEISEDNGSESVPDTERLMRDPAFKSLCGVAGLLQKVGAVSYGFHSVRRMATLHVNETAFFFSAREGSEKISSKLSHLLSKEKIINSFTLEELGAMFHRPGVSHFCIRNHALCDLFKQKLILYKNENSAKSFGKNSELL